MNSLWEQDFLWALQVNSIFLFSSMSENLFALQLACDPLFNPQGQ